MICVSGDRCNLQALEGKRFCEKHQAQLDRIRIELKSSAEARMGTRGRRKKNQPVCIRTGCTEPRESGSVFCEVCNEAGFQQNAA